MAFRKIANLISAPQVMMGPISLRQPIPLQGIQQVSPFVLLHHFDLSFEPGQVEFEVPSHPHSGFCPVTLLFEGGVEHKDSLGNVSVIKGNEVQWINAGRGIIHSEEASPAFKESGGRLQGIQLWINLLDEDKKLPPTYQAVTANEINLIQQDGIECRLISGEFEGQKGPVKSSTITAMLRMNEGGVFTFHLPSNHHACVYVLEGEGVIQQNTTYQPHQFFQFAQEEGSIELHAHMATKVLILSGLPIDEPLVTYGPFVATSETAIRQAMINYQQGLFGEL